MFHVTWTVSAFVMISVRWSNQRAHQVIGEKLLCKEFHCGTQGRRQLLTTGGA